MRKAETAGQCFMPSGPLTFFSTHGRHACHRLSRLGHFRLFPAGRGRGSLLDGTDLAAAADARAAKTPVFPIVA